MPRRTSASPVMRGALVVVTEAPVAGDPAADLRPHLTVSQSTALQRRFLKDTIGATLDLEGMDFFVACAAGRGEAAVGGILPSPFRLISVTGPDIGNRLGSIFDSLFRKGYEHVLILGSHSPDLPVCLLEEGADVLASGNADLVIGPSERGGLYLVGLSMPCRNLLDDLPWESHRLSRQVLSRARSLGLRTHRLPEWYDLASIEDLRRHLTYYCLRREAPDGSSYRPATGAYLSRIRNRLNKDVPAPCRADLPSPAIL